MRFVVAVAADVIGDCVAFAVPSGASARGGRGGVGDAQGSVEGEPRHEFGVHVVLGVVADLPDTGVGFAPVLSDPISEAGHGSPGLGVERVACSREEVGGVEDPSVGVELVLAGSPVADANGSAVGVARPVVECAFGSRVFAVQCE